MFSLSFGQLFHANTKNYSVQFEYKQHRTGISFLHTRNIVQKQSTEGVWKTLLNIHFRLIGFQFSHLLIHFRNGPHSCSHKCGTKPIRYVTLTFENGVRLACAGQLRSLIDIARKSLILSVISVNKSLLKYGFVLSGTYIVNSLRLLFC